MSGKIAGGARGGEEAFASRLEDGKRIEHCNAS